MKRPLRTRLQLVLLALAVLTGFLLRWSAADHDCITAWDEAYHALAAKNLAAHPLTPTLYEEPYFNRGLKDWSRSHVWLHKPPVPLWMMAACIRLAGENAPAFRFPSVVMGSLMALLAFLILRELFGEEAQWAGVLAAWLTALNPLMIRLVSGMIPSDHTDLAMSFFVMLSVFLFAAARRRDSLRLSVLAGAAMGLGFLSKAWPALTALVPGAVLLLAGRGKKGGPRRLAWSLAAFALTVLPWHVYTCARWPAEYLYELRFNTVGHLAAPLTGAGIPFWYYFELIPSQFGGAAAAAFILVLGAAVWCAAEYRRRRDPRVLALLLWALVPYAVFSLSRTKLYAYTAPAVPALLLLAAVPMLLLKGMGRRKKAAMLCAAAVWGVHLLSTGSERLRADFSTCPGDGVYNERAFRRGMTLLRALPGRKVLFNVLEDKHIEAMYRCGCSAYPGLPSPAALRRLEEEGAQAYVLLDPTEAGWEEISRGLKPAGLLGHVTPLRITGEPHPLERSPYEL